MSEKIRVLVVDDLRETRESVFKLLQFDGRVDVVGEAESGSEGIAKAKELRPDVILMDVNMPDMDGIAATKVISQALPGCQIIIMSVQSDTPYLRRAMLAGARDFLMKPFSLDELTRAVYEVYERRPAVPAAPAAPSPGTARAVNGTGPASAAPRGGHVVACFSPKGGSGCTTLASNIAVVLAQKGHRTLLIDGNFQFGTVSVMLNLKTSTTILDLVERMDEMDEDLVGSVTLTHDSGVNVLLAPRRPEMAELITADKVSQLLSKLRDMYDVVVLDTPSCLNDITVALLDQADKVLLVVEQSLPSLKTARDFLDLAQGLKYAPEKIMLTVNRDVPKHRIGVNEISNILTRPVHVTIPLDFEAASQAADGGHPLVVGKTRRRPISRAMGEAAGIVATAMELAPGEAMPVAPAEKQGFLARLLG